MNKLSQSSHYDMGVKGAAKFLDVQIAVNMADAEVLPMLFSFGLFVLLCFSWG